MLRRFYEMIRPRTNGLLPCGLAVVLVLPLLAAVAPKVKEVVVRYDDGTEEVLAAADRPVPGTGPAPAPGPRPGTNAPPTVSLVDPAAGTAASAPAYLLLRAEAADADGAVEKVEFYAGKKLLGTSVARPHMIAWREVPQGEYTVTAKATDDRGATTTSSPVKVSIKPAPQGKTLTATSSGDIGRLAQQLEPGDTLLIKPGTYAESVRIRRSGTPERPITIKAETPGTVTIQPILPGPVFWAEKGQGEHVIVSGLTFRGGGVDNQNNHEAAVRPGTGWRVEDCTVEQTAGVGLSITGRNIVLLRVTAQDNGRAGIGGTSAKSSMVLDCVSRRNNAKGDSNGGGGKFTRSNGLLVQGHESDANTGVGIWFDYNNIDVVVRDSHVHHNVDYYRPDGKLKAGAAGIFFEISGIVEKTRKEGGLLAEGNYVHDNQREGIQAWGSRNVTIRNNTLVNDTIELKDERDEPFDTRDITVTGNRLKQTGIVADKDTARNHQSKNIVIDGNTYDSPHKGVLIRWGSSACKSLPEARRSLGFERTGKLGKVTPPAPPR